MQPRGKYFNFYVHRGKFLRPAQLLFAPFHFGESFRIACWLEEPWKEPQVEGVAFGPATKGGSFVLSTRQLFGDFPLETSS